MTVSRPSSPLLLSYADFAKELTSFAALASQFLERGAREILTKAQRELATSAGSVGVPTTWEIPTTTPVRTALSSIYHRGSAARNAPELRATMSCIWRITPQSARDFRLDGMASTRIRIEDADAQEIARYNFDIATMPAPGCALHVQVASRRDDPPFPKWLPVPRFSVCLPTPVATLEFILGELFHDEWARQLEKRQAPQEIWSAIQRQRWESWLAWQQAVVKTGRSPWLALKSAVPPEQSFHPSPPKPSSRRRKGPEADRDGGSWQVG
jgi:hypothetical protein